MSNRHQSRCRHRPTSCQFRRKRIVRDALDLTRSVSMAARADGWSRLTRSANLGSPITWYRYDPLQPVGSQCNVHDPTPNGSYENIVSCGVSCE